MELFATGTVVAVFCSKSPVRVGRDGDPPVTGSNGSHGVGVTATGSVPGALGLPCGAVAVGVAGTGGVGVNPVGTPGDLGVGSGESGGGNGESKRATEGDNVRANTMATATTESISSFGFIAPFLAGDGSIVARTFDRRKQVLPC